MRQQRITKERKPGGVPISAFSSTLMEKPKRGRRTIPDNFLLGARNDWAALLEESWSEIGWPLLQIRERPTSTIDDVRKAFQPVKEKPHNSGLANAFYRETVETATPAEVYRDRVRLGELQGEILRVEAKLTEIERHKLEIDAVLKTAGPEYVDTVREENARRQEALAQLQSDINRLTSEERGLDKKSMDQEAYVYASELLDFLQSGRYALNPQSVANALAGLPRMRWRQSHLRCSPMPLQQHPRPNHQVLRVILKLWKRCQGESKESLIEFFKTQLPKLPKKLDTRHFLLENWHDLKVAIQECLRKEYEDGEAPYVLTSIFMKNTRSQKSTLERMLEEQEKLKV